MIEIHIALREKFLGFGRTEFASWLQNGLKDLYQNENQHDVRWIHRSFDGMGGEILAQESIFEGIAQIYEDDVSSESGKLLFRQAIGDVLRESAPERVVSALAISDLIYLTGRIKARESLESFTSVIERDDVDSEKILYSLVAVLKSLSPCEETYQTTRKLISSPQFDDGYLFEALDILTECKPSETLSLLHEHLPRLNTLKDECQKLGANEWATFVEATKEFSENVLTRIQDSQEEEKVRKILLIFGQ